MMTVIADPMLTDAGRYLLNICVREIGINGSKRWAAHTFIIAPLSRATNRTANATPRDHST